MATPRPFKIYSEAELATFKTNLKAAITAVLLGQSYTLSVGGMSQSVSKSNLAELEKLADELGTEEDIRANSGSRITHTHAYINPQT